MILLLQTFEVIHEC